jgi:hypothetical protein
MDLRVGNQEEKRYVQTNTNAKHQIAGPGSTPRFISDRTRLPQTVNKPKATAAAEHNDTGYRFRRVTAAAEHDATPGAEDHGKVRPRLDEERCRELVVLTQTRI